MKILWDIDQGSIDWYRTRATMPTASMFDKVMTPKKRELAEARKKYACQIISARLLNWQADSLEKIKHIEDGKEYEPMAVRQLEMIEGVQTVKVGFIISDNGRYGASPDRLIGVKRGDQPGGVPATVEIKSPTIPVQMEYIIFGHEDAYKCQVQGQLLTAHAERAIFYSRRPRMPEFLVETRRDESFLEKLSDCLDHFGDELEEWAEIARAAGTYQMFEEIRRPVDADLGSALHNAPDDLSDLLERDIFPGDRPSKEAA